MLGEAIFESIPFWLLLAFILALGELLIPGALLMFFAASAALVALLTATGLVSGLGVQLMIFAGGGVLAVLLLRKRFSRAFVGKTSKDGRSMTDTGMSGRRGQVLASLGDNLYQVQLGDTKWDAHCETDLAVDQWVVVVGREGMALIVKPVAD